MTILTAVVFTSGCQQNAVAPPATNSNLATLRFIQASPDSSVISTPQKGAKNFDLTINGIIAAGPIGYFGASISALVVPVAASTYIQVPGGSINYIVRDATTSPIYVPASGAQRISQSLAVATGSKQSIVLVDSAQKVSAIVTNDTAVAAPSGQIFVRVVHAIPNGPAVTVNSVASGTATPVFTGATFKGVTSYVPVTVSATGTDTLRLSVVDASTSAAISGLGTATLPLKLPVTSGRAYTVFARGFVGASGNRAASLTAVIDR